jgi:hypothetical protein
MRFKLVDVDWETEENVEFGTCELCHRVGNLYYPVYTFEDETGKIHQFDGYAWDWGDAYIYEIDNIFRFADWVRDIDWDFDKLEFDEFMNILDKWDEYLYIHELNEEDIK